MGQSVLLSSRRRKSKPYSSTFVFDTQASKVAEAPPLLQVTPTSRGKFNYVSLVFDYYNNISKNIANVALRVKRFSAFPKNGRSPYEKDRRRSGDSTTNSLSPDGYASTKSGAKLQLKGPSPCSKSALRVQYGDVRFSSEQTAFLQTTPHELINMSETLLRDLFQLDLKAPLPPGKTNWEVIREVHELFKVVSKVLESIVGEVNDECDFYKTSTNRICHARDYVEDNEDIDLYEGLCKSFDDVSIIGIEHCLQAISLVVNCIEECQEITDSVPTFLLQAALDFAYTNSRINQAQERMIVKKKSAVYAIEWSLEQEEKRATHVWRLIATVSDYAIASQNRVLQLATVRLTGVKTQSEATLNLESRLQQSWTWLNRISKRVAVLCPSRKHDLFVCLLGTFIQATEELCRFQNLVSISLKGRRKRLAAGAASSFQRLLLNCLAGVFRNAEEVGSELKRTGLISVCEYPQVSEASDIVSKVLTLLLSTTPEQTGTTVSQSRKSSEVALKSGSRLVPLTKEYLEIVLSLVCKNAAAIEGIKESLKKLCRGLNKIHSQLQSTMQLTVDSDLSARQIESTLANQEEPSRGPSTSANVEAPIQPPPVLTKEPSQKRAKPSAFANPESYPTLNAPDMIPVLGADSGLTSNTNNVFIHEGFPSEGADSSLDRRPPSVPSPESFGRINIKEMAEVKHLGSGNSGVVTLMKFNSSTVVVKEPVCPDPYRARKRLERECTVHQRINSHSNIVRFLGSVVKSDEFGEDKIAGIVTEWCQLGDLNSAIKDASWIRELDCDGQDISFMSDRVGYRLYKSWVQRLEVVAGVAAGVAYMHNHHIVHRDLTCKHVLFHSIGKDGEFGVKICDFERGYYLPGGEPIQRTKAPANSPPWMGPEVLRHEKYGLKADVYSIGTLLWQLMYLEDPWTHLKERVGGGSIVTQHLLSMGKISLSISEADAPDDVPEFPDLVKLVKRARERDPDNRPTMAEFYKEVVEICARIKGRVFEQA